MISVFFLFNKKIFYYGWRETQLKNNNKNLELDFERINTFYANSNFAYLGAALSVLFRRQQIAVVA